MLSEKCNAFSGLLKNKGLKEERKTKVGLDAIDKSTTLESNKSHCDSRASRQILLRTKTRLEGVLFVQ